MDNELTIYMHMYTVSLLTAFGEVVDECVDLAAAVDVLVLGSAVECQVVHSETPLSLQVRVEECCLHYQDTW